MAQTTQNVSNLQINTVVHTKDANKKLNAFKRLLSSFKKIRMPNITASVTGFTEQTKKNAEGTLAAQNQTIRALDRQVNSYNSIIQRQRKSLLLARKIKDVVGSTRSSGGGSGGGRGGSRGSGGMGPNVPPGVRNNNRLNTTIDRSEALATSRGLDVNARANGRSIRSLGRDFRNSGRSAAEYRHELRRVNAELRRGRINTNGFGESMRRLRTYVVATTASMTLFAAGRDIVKTGLQIEGLEVALISITGSSKKAAEEYQFFRSVVKETGVDMIAAAKGFKQLTASAKGTKLEGSDVHDIFSEVSKQAAILGMTGDDTNGVFRAFSQIISKAKVSAEELNSQLGDRMFGAVQIAAKGMQMTTKDLLKFVSTGQLTAEEFIPKFMSALKEMNSGFKDAAALSKQVAFNRFNNSLTDVKNTIFKGGLGEGLKDLANGLSEVLHMSEPLATFLGGTLKGIIIAITAPFALLAAALIDIANALSQWKFGKDFMDLKQNEKHLISMAGTVAGLVIGLGVLVTVLKLVATGFALLKVGAIFTLLLNPITWVVAAIGMVAYATAQLVKKWHLVAEEFRILTKRMENAYDNMVFKLSSKWDSMLDSMKNSASDFATYIKEKFKDLLPDWAVSYLSDEGSMTGGVPKASRLSPAKQQEYLGVSKLRNAAGMNSVPYNHTGNPATFDVNVNVNDGAVQGLVDVSIEQREGSRLEAIRNNTGK